MSEFKFLLHTICTAPLSDLGELMQSRSQVYINITRYCDINLYFATYRFPPTISTSSLLTMKAKTILPIALLYLIPFAACDTADTNSDEKGMYAYTAYDANNVAVINGSLSLHFLEDTFPSEVEGEWNLDKMGETEVGPQVGEGVLRGTVDASGGFRINLNPEVADQNVYLVGTFRGSSQDQESFEGSWRYETLSGTISSGSFEAKRK